MITFDPGEDLTAVEQLSARFARERLMDGMREREQSRTVSPGLAATWEELGLALVDVPASLGGLDMGVTARLLVAEALASADAATAIALDRWGMAARTIALAAGDETGPILEPLFHDPAARAVTVVLPGELPVDMGVLTLAIAWVPADRVDLLIFVTDTEIAVMTDGIGLTPVRGGGLRAAGAASLIVAGIPAHRWTDASAAAQARALVRLSAGAMILGALRLGFDTAFDFVCGRSAFGKPIVEHQAVSFALADLTIAIETARLALYEASTRFDAGDPSGAASAFVGCVEASRLVAPMCVQLLGGSGFMRDYPVEKVMREVRLLGLLGGGIDAARDEAAAMLLATLEGSAA